MKNIIEAKMRDVKVKGKQLRRAGIIPCVISGGGLAESLSVQIDQATAAQLKRCKRDGSKLDIRVDQTVYHTLIKDIEYNGMDGTVVHITFQVLDAGKKTNSIADVILLNKDKVQGILEMIQMRIPHAAEPENLIDTVTVDLDGVPVGTTITVRDIPEFQNDKIEIQTDPDSIILRIKEKNRIQA